VGLQAVTDPITTNALSAAATDAEVLLVWRLRMLAAPLGSGTVAYQIKQGAYLSPNGRLVSRANAAVFEHERYAQRCRALWLQAMQLRYGERMVLVVEGGSDAAPTDGGVMLLARGRTMTFASNLKVSDLALADARDELSQL
jgi:hypothetical protein